MYFSSFFGLCYSCHICVSLYNLVFVSASVTSYHSLSPYQELAAGKSCEKIPVQPVLPADQPYKELVNLRYFFKLPSESHFPRLPPFQPILLADQPYKELVNLRYFLELPSDSHFLRLPPVQPLAS